MTHNLHCFSGLEYEHLTSVTVNFTNAVTIDLIAASSKYPINRDLLHFSTPTKNLRHEITFYRNCIVLIP